MDGMNALTIVCKAVDDSDFRPGLVEACAKLATSGLASTLPGRYGRFIYTILTNLGSCSALEDEDGQDQ